MSDGKIRNREYAAQGRDFSGLVFGRIAPTDIDAFLDFKGQLYIIIESKYKGATLSTGQRLAFERLTDALELSGATALTLICWHTTQIPQPVDIAKCRVSTYRYQRRWRTPAYAINVRDAVDWFRTKVLGDLDVRPAHMSTGTLNRER